MYGRSRDSIVRATVKRQFVVLSLLACLCGVAFGASATNLHRPIRHRRHFRSLRWNPMFRPSHDSLLLQNAEVDRLELPRIQDDDELEALKASGALLPIRTGEALRFDPRADGDTASSHLAGLTVDLQRRGMTKEQVRWMEHYLYYMKALGLVEPEEERRQWVFHIMVSGRYAEWRETQSIVTIERPDTQLAADNGTK